MEKSFIFKLSSYDIKHLLPQVSKALEKRMELVSRELYPGMWQRTDRFKNSTRQNNSRSALLSALLLAVGIFALIPGLVKPKELLLPLIVGAIAVVFGAWGFIRGIKNKKNPFDKSAALLLADKDRISDKDDITVSFSDDGMTIPADDGNTEFILYTDFECVIETSDALLIVYGERVTLLQKKDIVVGDADDLTDLISEKIEKYRSVRYSN